MPLLRVVLAVALSCVLWEGAAHAQVACGDTLGKGKFQLTEDLDCSNDAGCNPASNCDPALTLGGSATLDMAGFTVTCADATTDGVQLTESKAKLENGTVRGCDEAVVLLGEGKHRVTNVVGRDSNNGFEIDGGEGSRLVDCVGTGNVFNGFTVKGGSAGNEFRGCIGTGNGANGYNVSGGSPPANVFKGCLASNNGANGFNLSQGDGHVVKDSYSTGNDGSGFQLDHDFTQLSGTVAAGNAAIGFNVNGDGMRFKGCTAHGNDVGFDVAGTGNTISGNSALGNATMDLQDTNIDCDDNTWSKNEFGTRDPESCIN